MTEQKYKGPYRVVARYDGAQEDSIIAAGLDAQASEARAKEVGGQPHVQRVWIEDEPTGHSVHIEYERGRTEQRVADEPRGPYPAA